MALPDHLDLPACDLKVRRDQLGDEVFDVVRRKYVRLTPEEWVRQHFVHFLVSHLGCPLGLLSVEHTIRLNGMSKRADIVVHDNQGAPIAIVECKAPSVRLDQQAFDQAARYNKVFKVNYLLVTNGIKHFCCVVSHATGAIEFLPRLASYAEMSAAHKNTI